MQLGYPFRQGARFLKTIETLNPSERFELLENVALIDISAEEADRLSMLLRRTNPWARVYRDTNLYVQRVQELQDRAVIEIMLPGASPDVLLDARRIARSCEDTLLLASIFSLDRRTFQRGLGIGEEIGGFDLTFGPSAGRIRTSSVRETVRTGINVDGSYQRGFSRYGFMKLLEVIVKEKGSVPDRLTRASNWLMQSRQESHLASAIVKTSTALETLLVFSNTEPLAQVLSDRTAFLLSEDAAIRQRLSLFIRHFYDVRSGVVHGTRRANRLTAKLVENADKVTLMSCLTIAANTPAIRSEVAWKTWFDAERWGTPSGISRPIPQASLARTLSQFDD